VNVIAPLSPAEFRNSAKELADLLVDAVDSGASLGFLLPFDQAAAAAWWHSLSGSVEEGSLVVWAARGADRIEGTVSVAFGRKDNGRHRAEVAKLMVHRSVRGQGLARELLATAEQAAAEAGVTLLLLDTQTGSGAEYLYRATGWTAFGTVPGYATDPAGVLHPATFFYKPLSDRD
jgi:GNAT superfamily N-acetyltransferase